MEKDPATPPSLDEIYRLTKENNQLLRSMRRSQKLSVIGKILYWIVILGIGAGIFYFLKPVYENLLSVYSNVGSFVNGTQNTSSPSELENIFNSWQDKSGQR